MHSRKDHRQSNALTFAKLDKAMKSTAMPLLLRQGRLCCGLALKPRATPEKSIKFIKVIVTAGQRSSRHQQEASNGDQFDG